MINVYRPNGKRQRNKNEKKKQKNKKKNKNKIYGVVSLGNGLMSEVGSKNGFGIKKFFVVFTLYCFVSSFFCFILFFF